MKGRTVVIGLVLFVIIVVGLVYLAMTSTINKIKEENESEVSIIIEEELPAVTIDIN